MENIEKAEIISAISKNLDNSSVKISKSDDNYPLCIYDRHQRCQVRKKPFNICKKCPIGYIYFYKNLVQNIYEKIIGLSILMKKLLDPQK